MKDFFVQAEIVTYSDLRQSDPGNRETKHLQIDHSPAV